MKLRTSKSCMSAALLCLAAVGGIAAPITVPDFSFERTIVADGANTASPNVGTNWTAAGNGGVFVRNPMDDRFVGTTGSPGTLPAPGDGTNYFNINLGAPGYGWQDVGALQPNTVYTLTVAIGHALISAGGLGKIALINGSNPFDTILAATPVDADAVTAGTFADSTLVFTTGQQVNGRLTILLQGDSGTQLIFDNVRLDGTPAPQAPTTFVPTASPSTNVYLGTVVTLSEDPAGALPFHYQWQSDNGSGGVTFSDIGGANGTSVVVDTTSFGSGATNLYRVVVTNSFGASTSAPVTLAAIQSAPVVVVDTLPATGQDVEGSAVTFTATLDGTRPIYFQWQVDIGGGAVDIANATNASLTLANLQLTDTASVGYSLRASNLLGVASSTARPFTVNSTPAPVDGVITSIAEQTGLGGSTRFTPSWPVSANSLIAGAAPSATGTGNFSQDASGKVGVLTDGKYGLLFPAGNGSLDFVTCGPNGGQSVTYTLPASATGYDLTNVVVYGGWSDAGRDQQRYILYYSTVASPTTFNQLVDVNYNPANPAAAQSATRATLTAASGSLAKNVAAVKLDFAVLAAGVENGYAGYTEIGISGVPSAPAPVIATNILPVTASDVEGSQVTFIAAFSSATPVAYQWRKISGGTTNDISGATSPTLTLNNLVSADTASYLLRASNASGVAFTSVGSLVVNPVPPPDGNGVIASPANQTATGATFDTTWTVASGSLIAGASPSGTGTGVFTQEGCGGIPRLTDGTFGSVGSGINTTLASCGQSAGQSVTYTLTGPASGYDLTHVVTYGGWSDGGRDQQAYTVSYSTVLAPTTFITLSTVDYNPSLPGTVRTADRLTLTSSTAAPLAINVARVKFDFSTPGIENGWAGFCELSLFGTNSAPLPIAPFVTADTLPVTGSDVVGSQVRFTAAFNGTAPIFYQWQVDTGSGPIDIPGATSTTLTLNNLQLTDTASPGYSLRASNSLGLASSAASSFTVNPVPAPDGSGIIVAPANQTGSGDFTPTWIVGAGSLIAGFSPSSIGPGSFVNEASGGTTVLTDGAFGSVGGGHASLATCGSGAGESVTYTLTGSASGYNLNSIVTYGGWGDGGRDEQHYTVSYSTVASPATFVTLTIAAYNPTLPGSVPTADRITLTPAAAGPLATGVAAVKFDFTTPAGENGWSGYAEVSLYGAASAPAGPTINPVTVSGGNLILTGTGGTPGGSYTWLTSTNVAAPLPTWTTNSTGVFSGTGSFSNAIPINPSAAARFFTLRIP